MEYHHAYNRSLPLISRHPTEQMFRSLIEAPVYDSNDTMECVCDSSRALHMLAPPEPNSTLLLDIVHATQKRTLLNFGNHCPSEYPGLATSSKPYDAFSDSRSPDEVNGLSRRPVHAFTRDCLSCSRPSSVGILRPIRDGEVPFAGLTASSVVDGHGIPHTTHKDLGSTLAGLEMHNILRSYFHPHTFTRSFSTHNPTSMERRDLQAPPLQEITPSPSSQVECNTKSGPSQPGLPDRRLASQAASFTLSQPTFRRTPQGIGPADFYDIRKEKQQIPSAGGNGLYQGPSPVPCASLSEGFKSTRSRTRRLAKTIDGSERRRPKRRRTRGDSTPETQRMTHIAVERNRRKQMNDHLCTLRDLMPSNFVQKTDQASIIGAAVEYVKELEVTLESLHSIQRSQRAMAADILNPSWNRLHIQTRPTSSAAASYAAGGCRTPSLLSASTTSEDAVHRLLSSRPTMSPVLYAISEDSRETNEVDNVESTSAPVAKVEVRFLGQDACCSEHISAMERESDCQSHCRCREPLPHHCAFQSQHRQQHCLLRSLCEDEEICFREQHRL